MLLFYKSFIVYMCITDVLAANYLYVGYLSRVEALLTIRQNQKQTVFLPENVLACI